MSKIVKKGRVGKFEFGYVEQKGSRNQWVVIYPNSAVYRVPENNMSSAFQVALYLNNEAAQAV